MSESTAQKKENQQKNTKEDNKKKKQEKEEDLSEEDKQLKERVELYCTRIIDKDIQVAQLALNQLCQEVRSSTTSMTSVPKPFKFLKDHYQSLMDNYATLAVTDFKKQLADFLSVLSMTMAKSGEQTSLKLLMEGTFSDYTNWGHEYLSHIAGDIGQIYNQRLKNNQSNFDDLNELVKNITPYFINHNAEADALDLLMEVDRLELILEFVNERNFEKIVSYLTSCSLYCADQDEWNKTLDIAYQLSLKLQQFTTALRLAIKLDKIDKVKLVFDTCKDPIILKQLAFQISRQRINLQFLDLQNEQLVKIASNTLLTDFYIKLAKDLNVMEPKHPDKIYKSYLSEKKSIDSKFENLASTYVNAFVHVGLGKDALMQPPKDQDQRGRQEWIHKVADQGLTAAAASLGMIYLWDQEGGASAINDYLNMQDGYAKCGANIAIGLYNMGITDECDPAKALLEEQINSKDSHVSKLGAIIGLGLAYAGSAREVYISYDLLDLLEILTPIVLSRDYNVEVSAFAALSLGLIFVGKCNEDAGTVILLTLQERPENELNLAVARYFSIALGLLFLGQQEACEGSLEALQLMNHPIKRYTEVLLEGCAYVGSGNVLKVQKMFHYCVEQVEEDKNKQFQAVAVLSLALIATSEDIGNEMALRSINHLLQYGEITIKRSVPLAIAILNLSNPRIAAQDLLQKLSHDSDAELSQRAILALGLIGCGTNNSRIAGILQQLANYYTIDNTFSNHLFVIRIAQGLLHTAKGLVSIQPYYSDRFLMSNVGMAGIIILMNSFLDLENIIFGKYHYVLYYLSLSIYPRMLFTVNEELENVPINIRVGQAVDVVGQAGKPKKITGFQTHQSPVILAYGERAELGTDEMIPYQDTVLENIVIIKKNEDYIEEQEQKNVRKKTL